MANKRITDVDFVDSLNSNESFFINQNNSIKQINKSNVVFDISNGGTGATTIEEARANLGISKISYGTTFPTSGSDGDIFILLEKAE